MKLTKFQAKEFQSIRDSDEFDVGEITCLVGKNESGKTALLQALYRLNPLIQEDGVYDVTDDYPRWDVEDYLMAVQQGKREPAIVALATFDLGSEDVEVVSAVLGDGALKDTSLTISKGYDTKTYFDLEVDEPSALRGGASSGPLNAVGGGQPGRHDRSARLGGANRVCRPSRGIPPYHPGARKPPVVHFQGASLAAASQVPLLRRVLPDDWAGEH